VLRFVYPAFSLILRTFAQNDFPWFRNRGSACTCAVRHQTLLEPLYDKIKRYAKSHADFPKFKNVEAPLTRFVFADKRLSLDQPCASDPPHVIWHSRSHLKGGSHERVAVD